MALTTEAQEHDAARVGAEIIDLAQSWTGWTLPPDATAPEVSCAKAAAVTQLTLKAVEAHQIPMDGAVYGVGVSLGAMIATQSPAHQRALLIALQEGLNRGNSDMRDMLEPKGRA